MSSTRHITPVKREAQVNGRRPGRVSVLNVGYDAKQYLHHLAEIRRREHKHISFFVCDLSHVVRKYREEWSVHLPNVHPFYSVKANDDPMLLALMARLGAGFYCTSKQHTKAALAAIEEIASSSASRGNRILFGGPCKNPSHVRYAAETNVRLLTFDSEQELRKIAGHHPTAQLLVKIKPSEQRSKYDCSQFGADSSCSNTLLSLAAQLGVTVVGVSFHVGSSCVDTDIYRDMIRAASEVFDVAERFGFECDLLDVGGGFMGETDPQLPFGEVATALRSAIDEYFSHRPSVRVIAEPGRYFAMSCYTLVTSVIGVKCSVDEHTSTAVSYDYTLTDGAFGSFSMFPLFHKASIQLTPRIFRTDDELPRFQSTLWGPCCNGHDCVVRTCTLSKLDVGDFVYFEDMGAYTMVLATGYSGMSTAKRYHVIEEQHARILLDGCHGDESAG